MLIRIELVQLSTQVTVQVEPWAGLRITPQGWLLRVFKEEQIIGSISTQGIAPCMLTHQETHETMPEEG